MKEKQSNGFETVGQDFAKVGEYLRAALLEVAEKKGGPTFQDEVAALTGVDGDNSWPDPRALKLLNDRFPGSATEVLNRAKELQIESHTTNSFLELLRPSLRSILYLSWKG